MSDDYKKVSEIDADDIREYALDFIDTFSKEDIVELVQGGFLTMRDVELAMKMASLRRELWLSE